jgi:hypothetical protein
MKGMIHLEKRQGIWMVWTRTGYAYAPQLIEKAMYWARLKFSKGRWIVVDFWGCSSWKILSALDWAEARHG